MTWKLLFWSAVCCVSVCYELVWSYVSSTVLLASSGQSGGFELVLWFGIVMVLQASTPRMARSPEDQDLPFSATTSWRRLRR